MDKLISSGLGKQILSNVKFANKNLIAVDSKQFYKKILSNNGYDYDCEDLFEVIRLSVDYLRLCVFKNTNATQQQYNKKYRFTIHQLQFDQLLGVFYFKKFSKFKKVSFAFTNEQIINILKLCYRANDGRKSFI